MTIIRVIDFETTGMAPPAQVCEVGFCDVLIPDGIIYHPEGWLCGVESIPPEVRAVHHIQPHEVAGLPPFAANDLVRGPGVTYLAAHNADFEQQFMGECKVQICTYKAALRIWPDAPSHSNGALRYWLEDQGKIFPEHELTQPAHRAAPDAYVTAHLLVALLHEGATLDQLLQWTQEPKLMPRCTIGKFRGVAWADVEHGYLEWMTRQGDMDGDLKWNAQRELDRRVGR